MLFLTFALIILSYFIGSISSAILICKALKKPDPRLQGSGNPGATNILRLHGPVAAAAVLLFDVAKGALPVYLSYRLGIDAVGLGFIAISACLGHVAPIFFQFKGGKGVATAMGAIAPIDPWLSLLVISTWGVALAMTSYSSIAALITACLTPLYTEHFDSRFTFPVAMLCFMIIICHKANYVRLYKDYEKKLSSRFKRR